MVYSIILPQHGIGWSYCVKRPFTLTFINQFSSTKLNYFIRHISLPDTTTLHRGIVEMFNLYITNSKHYAKKSDDDISIPTDFIGPNYASNDC